MVELSWTAPAVVPRGGVVVCIERVHAMPGQGVTSMFSLGRNYGEWTAIVHGFGWELVEVEPRTWKLAMHVTADKATSLELSRRLFPGLRPKMSKASDHGVAEALLLALYCKQMRQS
jgi:crossover junction endodeoxyribonuclease RuvC